MKPTLTAMSRSEPPDRVFPLPSSTQPGMKPMKGKKQLIKAQKGKKSQRGGLWPPRPNRTTSFLGEDSAKILSSPDKLVHCHGLSITKNEDMGSDSRIDSGDHGYHKDVQGYNACAAASVDNFPDKVDTLQVLQPKSQPSPSSLVSISPQPISPEYRGRSPPGSHKQFSGITPALAQDINEEPAVISSQTVHYAPIGRQPMILPQKEIPGPRQTGKDASDKETEAGNQQGQLITESNVRQDFVPESKATAASFYKIVDRNYPRRVNEPHQKKQAAYRPQANRVHFPSISPGIERSIETLRIALIADHFRVQHEQTTTKKHQDDTQAALRDLVDLQKDAIVEWKGRHQDLRSCIIRLTEKAKTNQRYVSGLQKDYEKLRGSVNSFHDQSKKALKEKIAEIDDEKLSLRHEFDVTLDVLAKSHRNLKATVQDLYARLVVCESKRRDFARDLETRTVMYEKEQQRCAFLENQLSSSVQCLKGELRDVSSTLIDRFNTIKSSTEDLKGDNLWDPRIKECLLILQNLQVTPFLTVLDAQKAEGMLRFIHKR